MNDLQKTEFDILKTVTEICDQFGITYFLVCGSTLGAVKYGGFIPWDDDVDIGMYREDYEKFCEKAITLLPSYYFLQTYRTDSQFPVMFAKVRDTRTTFIEKSISHLDINHGVYIDIFPLDGYPVCNKEAVSLERMKKIYRLQLACVYKFNERQSWKSKCLFRAERLLGFHKKTNKTVEKYERLISQYPIADSDLICNHGNWQGKLEYAPKWHYGEGTWATFEGLKVRIPENYDAYLTQKYGDWRADLPKEQQQGHHYYEIMDLERPYTDYIEKLPRGKIRLKNSI